VVVTSGSLDDVRVDEGSGAVGVVGGMGVIVGVVVVLGMGVGVGVGVGVGSALRVVVAGASTRRIIPASKRPRGQSIEPKDKLPFCNKHER
jgi:hypothetical protein